MCEVPNSMNRVEDPEPPRGNVSELNSLVMRDLKPMSEAPRDGTEILAYHKDGGNFHPVSWRDWRWMDGGTEHWSMRWHEEYRQYDGDYAGWVPYPVLDA